jgi:histidinol-phosphatase
MAEQKLLRSLLESAMEWAEAAGATTLAHFGGRVADETKGDGSPVTLADREAEQLLRERIRARFPGHGILGEEFGEVKGSESIRWIVDPIDGTRSFMRGVPLYGVLIGVEVEGEPVVGVAYFPALGEMVSAARGLGCHWNGSVASVNQVSTLSAAAVLTSDPRMSARSPEAPGMGALVDACGDYRSWGDAYGHILVATGRAEVMVDPVLSPWDAAPLLTILTEAGGRFTDLGGTPGVHGGSGVSTNGRLHDQVLGLLRGDGS